MNKYYMGQYGTYSELDTLLLADESVLWRGTPKKNAFIINASVKMAPIAILWLLFDGGIIFMIAMTGSFAHMAWFLIPFFALHLTPVWIWLSNIFMAAGRWKNTEYAITNKRVLIRNGFIGYQYESLYYADIENVSLHVGAIDRMLGVGDIYILTHSTNVESNRNTPVILDVENPRQVFAMVQEIVLK